MFWDNLKIHTKIPLAIVGFALVVGGVVGGVSYFEAADEIYQTAKVRLGSLAENRKTQLELYLKGIEQDLLITSANPFVHDAITDFTKAWNAIDGNKTEKLKKAYIKDNEHPLGKKHLLDKASGGTLYDQTHGRYHIWFRDLLTRRGYYDIFLFDTRGDLIYTVYKEEDFATSFAEGSGKWANTDLGKAFRAASGAKDKSISFFDFKPYLPSHGAPASFISTPVYSEGKKIGVLVFQMPIDQINQIMSGAEGLGETGETVIVGADALMRNNSRFSRANNILKTTIKTPAIKQVLSNGSAYTQLENYRNTELLTAGSRLSFQGVNWVIFAMQGVDEVSAPIRAMRTVMVLSALVILVLTIIGGYFIALTLTRPFAKIVKSVNDLASNRLGVKLDDNGRQDEFGELNKALVILRDNSFERQRLQEENRQEQLFNDQRQQKIDSLIEEFRALAKKSIEAFASNADQMQTQSGRLDDLAQSTDERTTTTTEITNNASQNVHAVAAATEEMMASVNEINQQVNKANEIVLDATRDAEKSNEKIKNLELAAEKIGSVIMLIQEIAEQTNLLALNATIEAARAGDAGRGFSVVASEVKDLASQTAKATEEISTHVNGIQSQTGSSVEAIKAISMKMSDVSQFTNAIAAAMEEQGAAIGEIASNIQKASDGTGDVVTNVTEVSTAVKETKSSVAQVVNASSNVLNEADNLKNIIDDFLDEVSMA